MYSAKPKPLTEWIEYYKFKRGEEPEVPQGSLVAYMATRGFMVYSIMPKDNMLYIHHTCGDGNFWHDAAEIIARTYNISTLGYKFTVSVKACMRIIGAELLYTFDKDGMHRFIFEDSIGRVIVATQISREEEGKTPSFFVTHYLDKRIDDINIKEFEK